jgi:hypothetical protein
VEEAKDPSHSRKTLFLVLGGLLLAVVGVQAMLGRRTIDAGIQLLVALWMLALSFDKDLFRGRRQPKKQARPEEHLPPREQQPGSVP